MLGHSGAGKTTYLSLMYAAMYQGVEGFQVRAGDDGHHRQLVADAAAIMAGRYPAATHRRACYDLVLKYDGAEVMPFSWRDHRGGAASGRTTDAADVAELNRDLLDSDAIVMFVDGAELVNDPGAARSAGRLSSHVLRALHSRERYLTPVVIAITKCDLVDLGDARVHTMLGGPLRELTGAIRASRHVQGAVVRVSCGPSPLNVTQPVLFTLRCGLLGMGERLATAAGRFSAAAEAAAGRDTLPGRFIARRRRTPDSGSLAVQLRRNAERAYQDLLVLIPPAERLDRLLRDVETF